MSGPKVFDQAELTSGVFSSAEFHQHEQVVFCHDPETGLKAIIGIHNTVLGPALGGTRMWNYQSEQDAVTDVLRLSRGMTYKAAISGLDLGGGKAVILGDSRTDKTDALFERFGAFIQSLSGKYITAEDVGISPQDILAVKRKTDYVTGVPEEQGGAGDPSPVTAYGVYLGMKAAAQFRYGSDSLAGKKVLVQGVGHVGAYLTEYLVKEGAEVLIHDIFEDKLDAVANRFAVTKLNDQNIFKHQIDIYAPCALGATVNPESIGKMNCDIIAGAANNQLAEEQRDGKLLVQAGIVYAPDFLINAGGLINVNSEIAGYDREETMRRTENIYDTTLKILRYAADQKITSHRAALEMAQERIDQKRKALAN
jgi:leucine dehydrogenase